MDELTAHQISTFMAATLFVCLSYFALGEQVRTHSTKRLLLIGLLWVGMTVCFEFGLGLFAGRSWQELLADYNLAIGRLWLVFLLVILVAPLLSKIMRHAFETHP